MISLTPAAARQINGTLEDEVDALSLRVAARVGADGSIEYALGLDIPREGDLALDEKGVPLLVGSASQSLLENTQIDFVEYEPGDFRFIFIAPEPAAELQGSATPGSCGSAGCSRCGTGS